MSNGFKAFFSFVIALLLCAQPAFAGGMTGDLQQAQIIQDFSRYKITTELTEKDKEYMRNYKVNGESLYNYLSNSDKYFNTRETNDRIEDILAIIALLYFEHGTPPSTVIDIQETEVLGLVKLVKEPNGREILKAYRNSRGEHLLSIAARSDDFTFQQISKMLPELLTQKSSDGITPFMFVALSEQEVFYDDSSQRYDSYYDYLAPTISLPASEKDPHGNTISMLRDFSESFARSPKQMSIYHFLANVFKDESLDTNMWNRMIKHPYTHALNKRIKGDVGSVFLYATLNQSQKPLHKSFLQQNLDRRDESNQLWRSLFAAQERSDPRKYRAKNQQIHDVVKVLGLANSVQETMIQQERRDGIDFFVSIEDPKFKTLSTLQSKILSTGGTFGMDFNRLANIEEQKIMFRSLRYFGGNTKDPNEIVRSLIGSYSSSLTPEQQAKLDDHQINCAVIALQSNTLKFDEIDKLLANHPRVKVINSRMRSEKLPQIITTFDY